MSQFKVNTITDRNNSGSPTLPYGATIPSTGSVEVQGNINVSGASTVGILSASSAIVVGIVSATAFVGDGSGLTGIPVISAAKAIALKIILDPLPFRS